MQDMGMQDMGMQDMGMQDMSGEATRTEITRTEMTRTEGMLMEVDHSRGIQTESMDMKGTPTGVILMGSILTQNVLMMDYRTISLSVVLGRVLMETEVLLAFALH